MYDLRAKPADISNATQTHVLGLPVSHSLSPKLHTAAYVHLGLPFSYTAIEVDEQDLPVFVEKLRSGTLLGLSLTMPLKSRAFELADEMTETVRVTKSANTLVLREGKIWAENTDVYGIKCALDLRDEILKESWFVLGTGATARSAILALQQLGVSNICVVGRNHKILSVIKSDFQVSTSSFTDIRHMKNAINTLPISAQLEILDLKPREAIAFDAMNNPWPTPVSDTAAIELGSASTKDLQVLLDVVYTPWPTPFAIRVESQHGIVFDGLQMLIHQAHAQVEIMTGMALPVSIMSEAVTR